MAYNFYEMLASPLPVELAHKQQSIAYTNSRAIHVILVSLQILLSSFIDVLAMNVLYFAFCRLMQDILYLVVYGLEKH